MKAYIKPIMEIAECVATATICSVSIMDGGNTSNLGGGEIIND